MFTQSSPSNRPLWLETAAIALLMIATLKIMANATISPALPALAASFPDDPAADYLTRFLVAAPSLTVVLIAPFAGLAADRFGRGPFLLAGVLLFALAGSAGVYLPDLQSILVSRLLLGVGVAMTMTAQVALVGDLFSGAGRSAFMGWQTAAINFSGFLFITLAGALAGLSPRLPFLVYLLPLLLVPLLLPILRQERKERRENPVETIKTSIGVKSKAWLAPSLAVGALTLVTVMLFFLMPSQLPFYLEANGFDSASGTALGLGALTLVGGFVAIAYKRISASVGLAASFGLGYALMGAGFAVLSVDAVWPLILGGAALVGAGYSLVQPSFLVLALEVAPKDRRGSVSGIVATSMFLGQVVSPLVMTMPIQSCGFPAVFAGTAVCLVLFAAVGFGLLMLGPFRAGHAR